MDFNREVNQELYSAEDMPKYPARVLYAHLAMKAIQIGAGMGFAVSPVYAYLKKTSINQASVKIFPVTTILGFGITSGLTYKLYSEGKLDEAGVDDRAYRISKHAGQNKVDKYSFLGGMAGAATGVLAGKGSPGVMLSAACVGVTAGMVSYLIEDKFLNKTEA
jgi:hypothetical protein